MNYCLNKNINSGSKNWISLIYSVEMRQKRKVFPCYANLYHYCSNIDPKDYIKAGTYPFNTKMSEGGDFGTEYPNDDGSIYKHEGVDYSGRYSNVLKD